MMLKHLPLVADTVDFMIKALLNGSEDCQHYYAELIGGFQSQCGSHPLEVRGGGGRHAVVDSGHVTEFPPNCN